MSLFPCPCCGYRVFDFQPGHHQNCPICGWEDDLAQLRFPLIPGSSNPVSLYEAQLNFQAFGAARRGGAGLTRPPVEGEARETGWRPLDLERDNPEHPSRGQSYGDSYPWSDTTVLYYWRPSYWRKLDG